MDGHVVDGRNVMRDGVSFAKRVSGEMEEVVVRINRPRVPRLDAPRELYFLILEFDRQWSCCLR